MNRPSPRRKPIDQPTNPEPTWTRTGLGSLNKTELTALAACAEISGRSRMRKAELIEALLTAGPPADLEPEAPTAPRPGAPFRPAGVATFHGDPAAAAGPGAEATGTEATAVGTTGVGTTGDAESDRKPREPALRPPPEDGRLHLVARDADWLHAWWRYRPSQVDTARAAAAEGRLQLRLHRFVDGDWREEARVALPGDASSWYLRAEAPGASFEAEIGEVDPAGRFVLLARSRRVRLPRAAPGAGDAEFVTLPFHLSFAELIGIIDRLLRGRRDVARALAELRRAGRLPTELPQEEAPEWDAEREAALRGATPGDAARPSASRGASGGSITSWSDGPGRSGQ